MIGVGRDDEVDAVGVPAGNSGQTFEVFEQATIRRIQKVILGQTLTSGTDGAGSRALGQVHNSVRTDKRDSDLAMIQPTVQAIIDALCKLNGWGAHLIEFADGTGLEKERSERDKNLYDIGVRFTPEYLLSNYDLDAEDFTLADEPTAMDGEAAPPRSPSAVSASKQPGAYPRVVGRPSASFSKHARNSKFTKHQQQIEELADAVQAEPAYPINPEDVRRAVLAAASPEDLNERLFALIGDKVSEPEFRDALEKALYAADVLGYVAAEETSK